MVQYPGETVVADRIPDVDSAELVETGGQKAVYRATIRGQDFALKVVALDTTQANVEDRDTETSAVVARVQREVEILGQVDVPVLARLGPTGLSTVQIDGVTWLYFTEEWIEGSSLRAMVRHGSLPSHQVAQLGVDLVQAACWLSDRGLVHRDIKPANVMWACERSRFVLIDPGIALDLYGPSLTHAAVSVGTIGYFSPEQMDPARKRSLDFRSALFTIGVVLYEAAAAEHPFMTLGTDPSQVLAGILTASPTALTDRVQDCPQGLSDLVARLLGKSPHQRFRTCQRARNAFEAVAASLGVHV